MARARCSCFGCTQSPKRSLGAAASWVVGWWLSGCCRVPGSNNFYMQTQSVGMGLGGGSVRSGSDTSLIVVVGAVLEALDCGSTMRSKMAAVCRARPTRMKLWPRRKNSFASDSSAGASFGSLEWVSSRMARAQVED